MSYISTSPRVWLEKIFYQCLGWHWNTTSGQLKRCNYPSWYNAADFESVSEHDLEQDVDDMPMEWDPRIELKFEEGYHQNMLQLNAIDALLHRLTDDAVLKWLNGGPRPRNVVPLSPESHPYLTRGAARSMEGAGKLS
jgi:hypothetical protein